MRIDDIIQQPGQKERLLKNDVMRSIHVAIPGEVVSYNPDKRTVNVQPVLREWNSKEQPPVLLDVPVYFPGKATMGISFPVEAGDECLVIFADHCVDAWLQSGGVNSQNAYRLHDLSDGFAFVGFRSGKNLGHNSPNTVNLFGMFYVDSEGYVCQRIKEDDEW